jgi:Tfp pilus assembly protein PilV
MRSSEPLVKQIGVGLVDVLVALALLAVALLGSVAALTQTLAQSRAAALHTRAVDLAADFAEELRASAAAAERMTTLAAWQSRVAQALPVGTLPPAQYATAIAVAPTAQLPHARVDLVLRWHEPPANHPQQLTLPVAAAVTTTTQ